MSEDFAVISMDKYCEQILGKGRIFVGMFYTYPIYLHGVGELNEEERANLVRAWGEWHRERNEAIEKAYRDFEDFFGR